MLENICQALRELPDENLFALLQKLQFAQTGQRHKRTPRPPRNLPPPPRDPREMDRGELTAYLQSARYFPQKADLLEFAKRYGVPANNHTPREEIIRLCVRMLHDIPHGFIILRALASEYDPVAVPSEHSLGN